MRRRNMKCSLHIASMLLVVLGQAVATSAQTNLGSGQIMGRAHPMRFMEPNAIGTLCLSDLKDAPVEAIVKPVGLPTVEYRETQPGSRTPGQLAVGVQEFMVLDGISPAKVVKVVFPLFLTSMEPIHAITPLAPNQNYILIGGTQRKNELRFGSFEVGLHIWTQPRAGFYGIKAKGANEVMGWSLAATNLGKFPPAKSREEQTLLALAVSTSVTSADTDHPSTLTLQGIVLSRSYSYFERGLSPQDAYECELGGMKAADYEKTVLVPKLWEAYDSGSKESRSRILTFLAAKQDARAIQELGKLPPP